MSKKLTNNEFINRASTIHNNFYDYSKTIYSGYRKQIIIIDPIYGEFHQLAGSHLKGCGHPARADNTISDKDEFILKATIKHKNTILYDYSKVFYIDNKTPVCIIDPIYGEFWQRPNDHLNGKGHTKRGRVNQINKLKSSTEEFIYSAKQIHGDLYDYSMVDYVTASVKVLIKDEKYGDFWQTPNSHLSGNGNPARYGEQQYAYINGIYKENKLISIKYGIETTKGSRVIKQNANSIYNIKTIRTFHFNKPYECIQAEKECINLFQNINKYINNQKGHIKYGEMEDGWSETTHPNNISIIEKIYHSHNGVKL